jgi:hypothetical protein
MRSPMYYGVEVGRWIVEHTIVVHPIEWMVAMLALVLWIAWMSVYSTKKKATIWRRH